MFRLRDGGEKVAVFYDGDFLRAMLEEDFEVNLNGWSPDQVTIALIEEGILPAFFQASKRAYAKLWWACNAAKNAGGDVDAVYNAAVNALVLGDIAGGTPTYVAQRCDLKRTSSNPFGNEEDYGGDRWSSKGINTISHRDMVDNYRANQRVSGTDLPPGIQFRNVAVIISGQRFEINSLDNIEVETINALWDRESMFLTH